MITVQIGGFGTTQLRYQANESLEAFYERLRLQEKVHFKDQPKMRDVQDAGRVMNTSEIMMDGRLYDLEVWLESA